MLIVALTASVGKALEAIVQSGQHPKPVKVVGRAATLAEGKTLAHRVRPQVIVIDAGSPGFSAEALPRFGDARIIVTATFANAYEAVRVLSAGAQGYVRNGVSPVTMESIVRGAAEGVISIDPVAWNALMDQLALVREHGPRIALRERGLTEREIDTLREVTRGLSDAEIAAQLGVSVHTIRSHTRSIYRKLGVSNRVQASASAFEHRLL